MPLAEILAVLMVAAVIAALMAGYPVALTLAGVSLAFAIFGQAQGAMNFAILGALPQRIFGVMTNDVLLAIPLFIFMGVMLEQSRIAEDLLERMGRLFGSLRGGLGFSVVIVGAMLAAAWTLKAGGHVRVDIFYAEAGPRTRAKIDLVGAVLLLLPFALVLVWLSVPYAARSWAILERSQESSGLPLGFLLKTLIPAFALLMALQGIAQAIRAIQALARPR